MTRKLFIKLNMSLLEFIVIWKSPIFFLLAGQQCTAAGVIGITHLPMLHKIS